MVSERLEEMLTILKQFVLQLYANYCITVENYYCQRKSYGKHLCYY